MSKSLFSSSKASLQIVIASNEGSDEAIGGKTVTCALHKWDDGAFISARQKWHG